MKPEFQYNIYEQTPFDKIPVLEGVVDGLVYFEVASLLRADGLKGEVLDCSPEDAYSGKGKLIKATVGNVDAEIVVISFSDAFQRVYDDALAQYLEKRRRALLGFPVTNGVQIKSKSTQATKTTPAKQQETPKTITAADLLEHLGAICMECDLRLSAIEKRLSALEAK